VSPPAGTALKDAFLAQVKASKVFFYNTVVAQAYRVDVTPSKITFAFLPNQRVPKQQCDDMKAFLEDIALKVAGQKIPVSVTVADASASAPVGATADRPAAPAAPGSPVPAAPAAPAPGAPLSGEAALREQAMADPSVQALFEIFPVEKSKVEEM